MKEQTKEEETININNIRGEDNFFSTSHVKLENDSKFEASCKIEKKESETLYNQPLSLEIPEVNVNPTENQQVHIENPDKEKLTYTLNTSFNHPFLDMNSGFSPFITNNIHNVSFNNLNLKGKNLFCGGNNFESPFRKNTMMGQYSNFSPSPLTLKIANSASINKQLNEYEGLQNYPVYGLGHFYPYNNFDSTNMVLSNDSQGYPWKSKSGNSPLLTNRISTLNKAPTGEHSAVDLLSYLNNQNQKEIKQKENVRIKLCKNEKLIKSMFEIKEDTMLSSEENSRKHLNENSNILINSQGKNSNHSNNTNNTNNTATFQEKTDKISLEDSGNSSRSNFKYKLDGGKILNNISYTLNNVNADFKILPIKDRENIGNIGSSISYYSNPSYLPRRELNFGNYNYNNIQNIINNNSPNTYTVQEKPKIKVNFLAEEMNLSSKKVKSKNENYQATQEISSGYKMSCNCKKSKCLKLYCECFANGDECKNCNCVDCHNTNEYIDERMTVIKSIKDKNPNAFGSKIDKLENNQVVHSKGCNCNKSGCQKKYCECFQGGIGCSELCRCRDCKNNKITKHKSSGDNFNLLQIKSEIQSNYEHHPSIKTTSENPMMIKERQINQISYLENMPKIEVGNNKEKIEGIKIESSEINEEKNNYLQNASNPDIINGLSQLPQLSQVGQTPRGNNLQISKKKSKSKLTEKKRNRKSLSKSKLSNSRSAKKKENILKHDKTSKIEDFFSHSLTTPKKNSRTKKSGIILGTPISKNLFSDFNSNLSSVKQTSSMKTRSSHKDTTLSHLLATAPTTTAASSTIRRSSNRLNMKDLDSSVVKKLNMNVSNEPLLVSKSYGTGNKIAK